MIEDPMAVLQQWLEDADRQGVPHARTMALCTVGPDGAPSVRSVPLRAVEDGGLVLFTSLASSKTADLVERPDAVAVLFSLLAVGRQVRIDATATVLPPEVADERFRGRPRPQQIRAWLTSPPTTTFTEDAEREHARVLEHVSSLGTIPRPPDWAVVRLEPRAVELWEQGDPPLPHRVLCSRNAAGGWDSRRLTH